MKRTYGPINWFLYFLYGLTGISLWFWGKVFNQKRWVALSSIFEDAQFIGFKEARRRSSGW